MMLAFVLTKWGITQSYDEKLSSELITQMHKAQFTEHQDLERNPPTRLANKLILFANYYKCITIGFSLRL